MASKSIDHHRCYTYVLYKISLDIYIYTVTPSYFCQIILSLVRPPFFLVFVGAQWVGLSLEPQGAAKCGKLLLIPWWVSPNYTFVWSERYEPSLSKRYDSDWKPEGNWGAHRWVQLSLRGDALIQKKAHLGMGCWFCWWKIFNSKKIWRFFKIIFFDVYFEFPRLMIVNLNWKKPFRHFDAFDPLLTVFLLAIFCTSPWVDRTFQNPKAINVQLSARVMQNYNDFVSGMQMARSLAYLITNPTRTSRKKQGSLRSTPPSHASRSGFLRIRY